MFISSIHLNYYVRLDLIVFNYTEPLPPPDCVYLDDINETHLSFHWSPVQSRDDGYNCSNIVYKIIATNCGECPRSSTSLSVSCTNITIIGGEVCSFAIATEICGNITGDKSDSILISLEGELIVHAKAVDKFSYLGVLILKIRQEQ